MCGRYTLFTDTEAREIREIIEAAQRQAGSAPLKTGEIFPTNLAPIPVSYTHLTLPTIA